jgi:predicted ATPase
MGKSKTKVYDALRAQAVKASALMFNVSETYVRRCISVNDIGGQSEEIKRYFNKIYNDLQRVISQSL